MMPGGGSRLLSWIKGVDDEGRHHFVPPLLDYDSYKTDRGYVQVYAIGNR